MKETALTLEQIRASETVSEAYENLPESKKELFTTASSSFQEGLRIGMIMGLAPRKAE